MGRGTLTLLVALGLGTALLTPIRAEWVHESSKTFNADRKAQMHPCCPAIEVILEMSETPAAVCPYYTNNLKKGNKGRIGLRAVAIGLASGEVLGEIRVGGRPDDNFWGVCTQLPGLAEPCMLSFEFSLAGFPKVKSKKRHVDGFTVGVITLPGVEAVAGLSGSVAAQKLQQRMPSQLPRWH